MSNISMLASITIKHNYFKNELLSSCVIQATQESLQTMKNQGIFLRNKEGGLDIGIQASQLESLKNKEEKLELSFHLTVQDATFFNITDLPEMNPSKQVFKFEQDEQAEGQGTIRLHKHQFVNEEDLIDYEDSTPSIPGQVALIKIVLNPDHLLTYEINFNRRKVYWKYAFIDTQQKESQNWEVSSNNSAYTFVDSIPVTLTNGQQAFEVSSNQAIDFQEQYDFSFSLAPNDAIAQELKLPYANPNLLNRDDQGNLYTQIFVYV